jgi:hypothetical protein
MTLTIRLLMIVCLLLPGLNAAAIRLLEVNGDAPVIERVVAGVSVPRDGVVVIIPDRIFAASY